MSRALGAAAVVLVLGTTGCLRAIPVDPKVLGGQAVTSVVVAADGTPITTLHAEQDRRPLALADTPKVLVQAVLAAEDRRFYEHRGVDVRGIARAAVRDLRSGSAEQGGSTITQQLVKNTLVTPEKTVRRKIREAALAMGLERTLTKDQILERYLNTVYFGQGAYGVGAAVRTYFGHAPSRISLPEAALLAGLVRSPSTADPVHHPAAARTRRAQVLRAMVQTGAITAAQAGAAGRAGLPRVARRDDARYPAAHAVQDAVSTLLADRRLGTTRAARESALFRGGLRIQLTIDLEAQRLAEEAVRRVLPEAADPYAGLAAVKPGDGAVTVMVGGRDFFSRSDRYAKVNLARGGSTKRQAGSTFKVFALIAALEHGLRPEDTVEAGAHVTLPCRCPQPWEVDNYEGSAYGRITLRKATESSVNTAYARVVQRIGDGDVDRGMNAVLDVAERLGVRGAGEKPLRRDRGPAVVLGAQEVDPVEMAAAYAALAAKGVYAAPYLVASVTDASGRVLLRNGPRRVQAVPAGVAAVATDVLQGVVTRGTGLRADLPRPVAGKTGTSTRYADAWFVGYTPDLAAAVWVGVPGAQVPMTPENGFRTVVAGGTFPTEIWAQFAQAALLGVPPRPFEVPEGATVRVAIDVRHDCLPNRWTPDAWIEERDYLRGQEPAEECTVPSGPAATTVPSVLGLVEDYAAQRLEQVGFGYRIVKVYDATHAPGSVVGQSPASGTVVEPGTTVVVEVSGGPRGTVTVPDLLGLDAEAARRALAAVGLLAEVVVEASCTGGAACQARLAVDAGTVWRQDVAAGSKLAAGKTVGLAVGPRAG